MKRGASKKWLREQGHLLPEKRVVSNKTQISKTSNSEPKLGYNTNNENIGGNVQNLNVQIVTIVN